MIFSVAAVCDRRKFAVVESSKREPLAKESPLLAK
jgi:hypothetical protein